MTTNDFASLHLLKNSTLNKFKLLAFLTLSFVLACKTSKPLVVPIDDVMETEILDTLTINGNDPRFMEEDDPKLPYRPSASRYFDLIHTKLDLKFNYHRQWVMGKAELDLTPYFASRDSLVLDAKGMDIHEVKDRVSQLPYTFVNTGEFLIIKGTSAFTKKDTIRLSISYTAKPNEGVESGSDAIHSDKGLFFINPLKTDTLKPVQIWTQGETENNSKWFPTIDKPNERCTGEISLTVDTAYVTLSNGRLARSQVNADGTRTDTWIQDKPHAPYLFMIAVGNYHVESELWNHIPLQYFVEKEYAPYAKAIFNHTPEMMTFFTRLFGYDYPWSKYSQIVTRDYVSGAMENTTASVFGEFVQKTDRELIDNDNDYIVAHELSHQWFGNLVTLESWANLVLNEGFANYSEYLWMEHKYGRMKADEHRSNELAGYINSTFNGMHPLIHYRYANKEDMFDAHSYNKGGLVLHHLRKYLGDDVFFTSLQYYLKKNEFTDVEGDELRLAFEEISGEDLNWFFDQWFYKKGHPELTVNGDWDATSASFQVSVFQEASNVWRIPVDLAIYYADGKIEKHRINVSESESNHTLKLKQKDVVAWVFDGESHIPGIIEENKTEEKWLNTFKFSPLFGDKYKACQMLADDSPYRDELIALAIKDGYYFFRDFAVNVLAQSGKIAEFSNEIKFMAENDPHSLVRESAIRALGSLNNLDFSPIYKKVIEKDKAYNVIGEAISQLFFVAPEEALRLSKNFEKENTPYLIPKIAALYAESQDKAYYAWFIEKIAISNPYQMYELCSYFNLYLINQSDVTKKQSIELYKDIAKDADQNKYKRYIATASLFSLKNLLLTQQLEEGKPHEQIIDEISKAINSIKVVEKDRELIERYSEF